MKTSLLPGFKRQFLRARYAPTPSRSVLLIALGIYSLGTGAALAGQQIQPTDLTYLGTINIAYNDSNCGGQTNQRALGLTYNPSGNGGQGSFYISGRRDTRCVAEITKPAIGGTATFIQNYADPTNGKINSIPDSGNGSFIGGHLLHNGNLFVTGWTYYDAAVQQNVAIFKRSPTLTNNSGLIGPVAVGPGQQGMYNQYMDNIPSSFQATLGGQAVIGGCCMAIISRTSLGPSLYAFNPDNLGSVTPLLGYPDGHQTLNTWGASGSHPEANPTTKMAGVTFIEGTDTVLFVGRTGTGSYCYGAGSTCGDPEIPDQGTHAYPYVIYMWAYDVDDLAQVKAGAKQMWDVMPYAKWQLSGIGTTQGDEYPVLGITFDSAAKRLYILKNRETNGEPWPQIHVYNVNVTGSTTTNTAPPAPSGLIAK